MHDHAILGLGVILLVASLVAMLSRLAHLPYSVGLVLAGIALPFMQTGLDFRLTRDLIFEVLLPPLVFEAALQLRWRPFRDALPVTLMLAFAGVAIATAVVTGALHLLLGWSWIAAGLFGVLIAATDPVAVIAAFKELHVVPRLGMLVESESLLNDGAAAVGFGILLAVQGGDASGAVAVAGSLLWTVLGGVAAGAVVAGGVLLLVGRTDDHLVETTLTTIAAYGSFILAEHLGMSGVLATVTAGLLVGNVGRRGAISEGTRGWLFDFWAFAAFLANSVVFILIGAQGARHPASLFTPDALIAIAAVLLGRALAVYPVCLLFSRSRLRVDARHQHVLVWGGLRGALGLALALALPDTLPERGALVAVAFAVVAFSIFVQGMTMPWLIRRLRLREADATA
ncbi:cation:proton antiporter [Lichenicoccus roseus]|uniref:Sodium:proton antiporter n=1 Tax=Lichenicoccus roseus TaxID=2683649 RepID=A0A5R9JDY6_9PROT|nr:cation:proton antiporter [Lichenicoccus roseus]TLU72508.1 sodium:proton antiporter [Lichenicoccus roseus]